jgi:cytoskeletal protein CcmA (bactofilin family)
MTERDAAGAGEINALLGRGTEYEGKLVFEGRVRIDGRFRGLIVSDDVLILGEGAEVHADVRVGTLIMRGGELHGDVHAAKLVELHAASRVRGTIHTPQIFVDRGAIFEGRCEMGESAPEVRSLPEEHPIPEWLEGRASMPASEPPAAATSTRRKRAETTSSGSIAVPTDDEDISGTGDDTSTLDGKPRRKARPRKSKVPEE